MALPVAVPVPPPVVLTFPAAVVLVEPVFVVVALDCAPPAAVPP